MTLAVHTSQIPYRAFRSTESNPDLFGVNNTSKCCAMYVDYLTKGIGSRAQKFLGKKKTPLYAPSLARSMRVA
jgi:hypothetical protein